MRSGRLHYYCGTQRTGMDDVTAVVCFQTRSTSNVFLEDQKLRVIVDLWFQRWLELGPLRLLS